VRDFGWNVFKQTGNIEAYLFCKEMDRLRTPDETADEPPPDEEADDRLDPVLQ
jgi:hypothetical protein